MAFGFPLALLFLGLFIPVILLYLLKQRRRRVEVPTLFFWDRILREEHRVTSFNRLRKLLSLLLQLLFIALLTFALARPVLSGRWTGARRMVVLLDASASMLVEEQGRTRFEIARQKTRDLIREMSLGDTLMLVKVGASPEIVHAFSDNRRDLADALAKIEPGHSEARFDQALALLDHLPADERETQVYLVTDGAFEPIDVPPRSSTRYAFLKVGEAKENVGITLFEARPLPSTKRDFELLVELTNHGESEQVFPIELRVAGNLVDAFEISLPAGATVRRNLKQYSPHGGEVEVFADVKDSFILDNRAFGVLPPPRPVRVTLVTQGEDVFLQHALATDEGVELTVVVPDEYASVTATNRSDVTVFAGWSPPEVEDRNCIFILEWPEGRGPQRTGIVEKALFTDWDHEHPIYRHVTLQNIAFTRAIAVADAEKFEILASSYGEPLVLLKEEEKRKSLWIAFDPMTSDLPLRVAFPIMIANAVRYLNDASDPDEVGGVPIGSVLDNQRVNGFASYFEVDGPTEVIDPGGRSFVLTNTPVNIPVDRAGIYRARLGEQSGIPLFAANLNSSRESRIEPAAQIPLRSNEPIPEVKASLGLGFEPWFALVALAVVLSAVEWALFHRRVIE